MNSDVETDAERRAVTGRRADEFDHRVDDQVVGRIPDHLGHHVGLRRQPLSGGTPDVIEGHAQDRPVRRFS